MSNAADALPETSSMGQLFELTFNAYHKRFLKTLEKLDFRNRAQLKTVTDQLKGLNLGMGGKRSANPTVARVLAWAKTTASMRAS